MPETLWELILESGLYLLCLKIEQTVSQTCRLCENKFIEILSVCTSGEIFIEKMNKSSRRNQMSSDMWMEYMNDATVLDSQRKNSCCFFFIHSLHGSRITVSCKQMKL